MALSITTGSGDVQSQAQTQSPQTSAGSGSAPTASSGSVQPGTATSVLTSSQGIGLNSTQLSVVNLSNAPQTVTGQQSSRAAQPKTHHVNPVLFGLAGAFLLLAIIFFVITTRSAKNTTL